MGVYFWYHSGWHLRPVAQHEEREARGAQHWPPEVLDRRAKRADIGAGARIARFVILLYDESFFSRG